jgi:carboxyl-terminal processing protease
MDTYHRYETGELYSRDSIKVDEEQKFVTETGKTVYGGGGIIPDVFVPIDTTTSYQFYNQILGKGIVREYALTLSDKFRKSHENGDLSTFLKAFTIGKAERDDLINMAKESGIAIPSDPNSFDVVETELIARTARNLFNGEGYFSVRSQDDEIVDIALDILQKEISAN